MENKINNIKLFYLSNEKRIPFNFKLFTNDGIYFQSYDKLIAYKNKNKIILSSNWNYKNKNLNTCRNIFLDETEEKSNEKIKLGKYIIDDNFFIGKQYITNFQNNNIPIIKCLITKNINDLLHFKFNEIFYKSYDIINIRNKNNKINKFLLTNKYNNFLEFDGKIIQQEFKIKYNKELISLYEPTYFFKQFKN